MKIIKHGNLKLYQQQEHICELCGCKFNYTLKDIENYLDYNQE